MKVKEEFKDFTVERLSKLSRLPLHDYEYKYMLSRAQHNHLSKYLRNHWRNGFPMFNRRQRLFVNMEPTHAQKRRKELRALDQISSKLAPKTSQWTISEVIV